MFYSLTRENSGTEDCPGLILYQGIFEGEYVDPLNIPLENIEKFSIFTDSMQLYP